MIDRENLSDKKVGVAVECATCGLRKKPVGRSIPAPTVGTYCCPRRCEGYSEEPCPGSLFPGESEADFGYPVGEDGVEYIEEANDAR